MKKVGIIGGGASGIMAAIAAAREGAQVTILEKQDRIGKKILATGNGKCNLSNLSFCVKRDYHSAEPELLDRYFGQYAVNETVAFFEENGLVLTEKNGYLYPRSGQASTVLNLFLELLEKYRVQVICETITEGIRPVKNSGFLVETSKGSFTFDSLILAAGSNAGTKLKDELGGLFLASMMGLKASGHLPALTALCCKGSLWKALAGVRCDAAVNVRIKNRQGNVTEYRERGELQLTDYGLSGIPTFQLSRHVSWALERKEQIEAYVDFFPELDIKEWEAFCKQQLKKSQGRNVSSFLEGMLNKKIAQVLIKEAGCKQEELIAFPIKRELWRVLELMRSFPVIITGTNPAANSQVCTGGVLLNQLDERLQAKAVKGLYVTGELADVDGRCGGYNLQWAFTSGVIAGKAAAKGKEGKPHPAKTGSAFEKTKTKQKGKV